jgi:hypothetical protein
MALHSDHRFERSGREIARSRNTPNTKRADLRIATNDIKARLNVSGAIARQELNFGDASGYSTIAGEYFSLKQGTDLGPLLKGLESDLCQSPHWGYMIEGQVTVTYRDGKEEVVSGGDRFYRPPGHTVRVSVDAEIILFSPQVEHCAVVEHVARKLNERWQPSPA